LGYRYIPSLTWASNTSDNTPLGCSSFLLVFGRLPTFPTQTDLPDVFETFTSVHATLTDIVHQQQVADEHVTEHLKTEQASMKKRYDENATTKDLKAGDIVFIYQPRIRVQNTKRKLQRNYHGRYMIAKFTTNTTVILKRLSDGKFLKKSVHIRRLKKGHVRSKVNKWDPLPNTDDDDQINVEDDGEEPLDENDLPESSFQQTSDDAVDDERDDESGDQSISPSDSEDDEDSTSPTDDIDDDTENVNSPSQTSTNTAPATCDPSSFDMHDHLVHSFFC
jgi:hypothetical protein